MNLNESELATLRIVWDSYTADLPGNGCDLFIRLFKENPSYIQWFPTFSAQLKGDPQVIGASEADFGWISGFIDAGIAGDKPDTGKHLRKLTGCHVRAKVTEVMYDRFKECLVNEMVIKLGDSVMTEDTVQLWHRFFNDIRDTIYPLPGSI